MYYEFEGIISEIETNGNNIISFKVCGTEGYVLKKDDEKINVFTEIDNGTTAYIFKSNPIINYYSNSSYLLVSALTTGKKIKMRLLQGGTKNQFTIGNDYFSIETLSICSN